MHWLARIFSQKPPRGPIEDPVLGILVPEEGGKGWRTRIQVDGREISFSVGGATEPNSPGLALAREIAQSFAAFEAGIVGFLKTEAEKYEDETRREEILQLEIEAIHVGYAKHPDSGMIFFKSPDQYRLWHCDFVNRRNLSRLVFDS